ALLVSGGSFALFQFTFATIHAYVPGLVLYPMTDIGGGIFSLVVTAIFLRFWKPHDEWHYHADGTKKSTGSGQVHRDVDPHAAAASAVVGMPSGPEGPEREPPLTAGLISLAWAPFMLMAVLLLLTGLVRQKEGRGHGPEWSFLGGVLRQDEDKGPVWLGPVQTN